MTIDIIIVCLRLEERVEIIMEKKYQIFISSTFVDLQVERRGIIDAILTLGSFPAGMEMFPASDLEQFEYIKTIIDRSDYYVLIVAGKYGTEAEDGISFTEKEYEYAKESGIPILVFLRENIDELPITMLEEKKSRREKLNKFRKKLCENRLVSFWNNSDQLKYVLYDSLSKEFQRNPREGWIRGNLEDCIIPKDRYLECLEVLLDPFLVNVIASDRSTFKTDSTLLHIIFITGDLIQKGNITEKWFDTVLANYFAAGGERLIGYYEYKLEKKSLEDILYRLREAEILNSTTENIHFTSWGLQICKYMRNNLKLYAKVAEELARIDEVKQKHGKTIEEYVADY